MSWLNKDYVLVPIDFSEVSFAALATASEFVNDISHLHVIHVLPELHPADPAVIYNAVTDESRKQHAGQVLQQKLRELGYEKAEVFVAIGDPSREIANYAKTNQADLLVMPSHGRTGLKHFLLGSVAERVVRLSACPVLVLR